MQYHYLHNRLYYIHYPCCHVWAYFDMILHDHQSLVFLPVSFQDFLQQSSITQLLTSYSYFCIFDMAYLHCVCCLYYLLYLLCCGYYCPNLYLNLDEDLIPYFCFARQVYVLDLKHHHWLLSYMIPCYYDVLPWMVLAPLHQ